MKIIKYAIENGINNFSEAVTTRDMKISIVELVNSYIPDNNEKVTTTDMINDYDIAETQLIGDE
jgi:hypothetical protein